ncbi:MAG TPA: ABC transporter permease [Gammaproteobacteria bacterium]|nr:ABC transporter permease [Gammaproteobacteria bacterium]
MSILVDFWNELRYSTRSLSRSPGFTVETVATIALGIGINAGVFSVLNGVLFRDLPAPDADELVSIYQGVEGVDDYVRSGVGTFSTAEWRAYDGRAETLSGVFGHSGPTRTTLGGEAPREIASAIVTCNYFDVMQRPPMLGRALAAPDCEPGANPVVVLGYELWNESFAASSQILGQSVELNRQRFTVVGVADQGTYSASPYRAGYYAPVSSASLLQPNRPAYDNDNWLWLYLIGRRADGSGIDQVRAELGVIAAQIDRQTPGRSTTFEIERATPMTVPPMIGDMATGAAAVLMTAFGLILLLACANVANLLLARGMATHREIAIRYSLGASRARVVRGLLTESMLIAIVGGLFGAALAFWSFQVLVAVALPALSPPGIPVFAWDISPDLRVLWFAFGLTLMTGVLFGLAPALQTSRLDLNAVIKQDGQISARGARGGRLRGTLIGVQVALCMALMIAAGLLVRGLYATYTVDPGFDYRNVAWMSLALQDAGYSAEETDLMRDRLMQEVATLPGVEAVAYAMQEPLGDDRMGFPVGLPGGSEFELRRAEFNPVTADFFSVFGIPILRGRTFTDAEIASAGSEDSARPVIVTESTARNFWADADPIGQTLLLNDDAAEVVGVVADAQVSALGQVDPYYVYGPARTSEVLFVRSRLDLGATASALRAAARAVDPALTLQVRSVEDNVAYFRGVSGMVTTLGAGLGVLALVLASVGIYGVVSYAVTRRYREIGIRMALGARARNVLGLIIRQTMRPVAIGAVIGIALAVALSGVLSGVLFGVSPTDPIGLVGAALIVLAIAFASGIVAARPATGTDPSIALRCE